MHLVTDISEKELLLQLKQGEQRAFDFFYGKYKARIFANALRLVHQEEIAEDILQNTFIKVWEKREQIDENQSFAGYLFRIAKNLVVDYYRIAATDRKLQANLMAAATELYEHIEQTINYKESQALLNSAIDKLPPQRQKIFRLCKIEGKSYEEVSELLGISTSTINDHIVKATRSVRANFFQSQETALLVLITTILTSR